MLAIDGADTISVEVMRCIRVRVHTECAHPRCSVSRDFDLALCVDGSTYVRPAGSLDSAPWLDIALNLPATLEILEVFRVYHDEPIKKEEPHEAIKPRQPKQDLADDDEARARDLRLAQTARRTQYGSRADDE